MEAAALHEGRRVDGEHGAPCPKLDLGPLSCSGAGTYPQTVVPSSEPPESDLWEREGQVEAQKQHSSGAQLVLCHQHYQHFYAVTWGLLCLEDFGMEAFVPRLHEKLALLLTCGFRHGDTAC